MPASGSVGGSLHVISQSAQHRLEQTQQSLSACCRCLDPLKKIVRLFSIMYLVISAQGSSIIFDGLWAVNLLLQTPFQLPRYGLWPTSYFDELTKKIHKWDPGLRSRMDYLGIGGNRQTWASYLLACELHMMAGWPMVAWSA